jgi:hypothetical protein
MAKLDEKILFNIINKSPDEVLEYFRSLDIELDTESWNEIVDALKKDSFRIAGINNANHLIDAKNLIEEAIAQGTDIKEFKSTLEERLGLRSWHAKLVVTQNISNAYNAGRYFQQTEDIEDFPYLRPITMDDSKQTKICQWLADQNIVFRADDKLLKNMYSPRHFHCRTIYVAISEKQAERLGLSVKPIKDIPEKYWNHKDFRKLPNQPFDPDISKYPKELQEKL